jgi:hypothetical protein
MEVSFMNFIRAGSILIVITGFLSMVAGVSFAHEPPPGIIAGSLCENNPPDVWAGGPSIAILPDGSYVVCHDQYRDPSGPYAILTHIYRSEDKGLTWTGRIASLIGFHESTLFVNGSSLYLIGGFANINGGYVAISKSTDGGHNWTTPVSASSGLLTSPGRYNGAPTAVLDYNGRIWRAFETVEQSVAGGDSREFRAMVFSAPNDVNLLEASNWEGNDPCNSIWMHDYDGYEGYGWLEGCVVADPEGNIKDVIRTAGLGEKAAIISVDANGNYLDFNGTEDIVNFPGGTTKFTIRYDSKTDLYWAIVNDRTDGVSVRNKLVLNSSADLVNWTAKATILENDDPEGIGFQYADWQFEGDDIIMVCRTAWGCSDYFHNAEYTTFHRIPYFRMLSYDSTFGSTIALLDAADDAEIDGHVNWRGDPKGDSDELRIRIYDPIAYPGANASHALIKWDFSNIPDTDIVTDVSLVMAGWDGSDGAINVYGIDVGDWNEATVTWNSWEATTKSIVLLGQLTSAGPANTAGQTIFSDLDLTNRVQDWIADKEKNHGLILKMSGTAAVGDSFSSKEDTWAYGHAPQLLIQHHPADPCVTELEATDDAEIDEHVNWAGSPKGDSNELRPMLYGNDYYTTGLSQEVLIKWDVSSVPVTDTVVGVTLELSGWEPCDRPIYVYGIEVGDWNEATITWNNWELTTKSLVFLGQFTSAGLVSTNGPTKFSDHDFTDIVQKWVNGDKANHGLILKMSGENPVTGILGAGFSSHEDADYNAPRLIVYHRPSDVMVLDTVEDAEIDGHANWNSSTKGIAHPEWNHTAKELCIRIYDPYEYPGAGASHALLKWDISSIPITDVITGVDIEMTGWDDPNGTIDVYGIELGDWDESTVTWNSWASTTKSLVSLGQLSSVGQFLPHGHTIFSDNDLTNWVQNWVDGTQENYGLILKMSGVTPATDSFSSHEDSLPASSPTGHAPQLVIRHIPLDVAGRASTPTPANNAVDIGLNPTLSWTAGYGAGTHKVYFGTTTSPTFIQNQTGLTYVPDTLTANTIYYWRIDEVGSNGTITGVLWKFTTRPGQANTPSPANSATGVSMTPLLTWTAGSGTTSHDVYFGTNQSNVTNAIHTSAEFKGNKAEPNYVPEELAQNVSYYWRVDEVSSSGTTKGATWGFTTANSVPLFVSAGTIGYGTTTMTPGLPGSIAINDVLLLFVESANQTVTISNQNGGTWSNAGLTAQGTGTAGSVSATKLTVFWSKYKSGQGAPTVACASGNHIIGRIIAIRRGVAACGIPWNVTAGNIEAVADTSASIQGATTTVNNTLVVAAIAAALPDAIGTSNFASWTNGSLASITERIDNIRSEGNGGAIGVTTGTKTASGAYNNTSVTLGTAAYKAMMSIAIKP